MGALGRFKEVWQQPAFHLSFLERREMLPSLTLALVTAIASWMMTLFLPLPPYEPFFTQHPNMFLFFFFETSLASYPSVALTAIRTKPTLLLRALKTISSPCLPFCIISLIHYIQPTLTFLAPEHHIHCFLRASAWVSHCLKCCSSLISSKNPFPTSQSKLASSLPKLLLCDCISISQSIYCYLKSSCMYVYLPIYWCICH